MLIWGWIGVGLAFIAVEIRSRVLDSRSRILDQRAEALEAMKAALDQHGKAIAREAVEEKWREVANWQPKVRN
jgi:hypothetical protein